MSKLLKSVVHQGRLQTGWKQREGRRRMCVMSLPRAAGVFLHLEKSTRPTYLQFWMVYPEISAGYGGLSEPSLEFVPVDKSSLIPPFTESQAEIYECKIHTIHRGVCACPSPTAWTLWGLILSLFLLCDSSITNHRNWTAHHRKLKIKRLSLYMWACVC